MEFRIFTCISLKGIYVHTLERTLTYVHAYIHTYVHTYARTRKGHTHIFKYSIHLLSMG